MVDRGFGAEGMFNVFRIEGEGNKLMNGMDCSSYKLGPMRIGPCLLMTEVQQAGDCIGGAIGGAMTMVGSGGRGEGTIGGGGGGEIGADGINK